MNEQITARVETITPERAKELLAANTHNRDRKLAKIREYALAMRRGEWTLNGEAIKIADDGTILDGQNRLYGCVESNTPFTTFIIYGLPKTAQETMDSGAKRIFGDTVKLLGYPNWNEVASLTRKLLKWDKYGAQASVATGGFYVCTQGELKEYLQANSEGILQAVKEGKRISQGTDFPSGLAILFYYKTQAIDPDYSDWFLQRVRDGVGLEQGNPILLFRDKLAHIRKNRGNGVRISDQIILGYAIKAWNACLLGKQMKLLTFTMIGPTKEKFPEFLSPQDVA